MILDDLQFADRYLTLHPGFAAAFAALRSADLAAQAPGRYSLEGDRLALILVNEVGQGRTGVQLEAHRRYIDIQLVIAGDEEMGWRSISDCRQVTQGYSDETDDMLFGDSPECWFRVPPGKFVIFFPEDTHAPLAGVGPLHKAVIKVAVD